MDLYSSTGPRAGRTRGSEREGFDHCRVIRTNRVIIESHGSITA